MPGGLVIQRGLIPESASPDLKSKSRSLGLVYFAVCSFKRFLLLLSSRNWWRSSCSEGEGSAITHFICCNRLGPELICDCMICFGEFLHLFERIPRHVVGMDISHLRTPPRLQIQPCIFTKMMELVLLCLRDTSLSFGGNTKRVSLINIAQYSKGAFIYSGLGHSNR
jgi:hypothetical protein